MLQAFILAMAVPAVSAPPSEGAACILAQARPADPDLAVSMTLLQPSSLSKEESEFVGRMKSVVQECIKRLRLRDDLAAKEGDEAFQILVSTGFRNRLGAYGINPVWVDDWFEAQTENVQMTLGCGEKSMSLNGPDIDSMRAALERHGLSKDLIFSQDKLLDAYLVTRVMANRSKRGLPMDVC